MKHVQFDLTVKWASLLSDISFDRLRFCHSRPQMHPNIMKKTVINRMIEETVAVTRLIISSLDVFADSVNNTLIAAGNE